MSLSRFYFGTVSSCQGPNRAGHDPLKTHAALHGGRPVEWVSSLSDLFPAAQPAVRRRARGQPRAGRAVPGSPRLSRPFPRSAPAAAPPLSLLGCPAPSAAPHWLRGRGGRGRAGGVASVCAVPLRALGAAPGGAEVPGPAAAPPPEA